MLMVLLTVLAVGLLSLSSISLRASAQAEAIGIARANARLALQLALGELQAQAGIDTRVTARADILNEDNPPVLGVWKSWEGTDHETRGTTPGRPLSPGSNYRAAKSPRFLAWLTSANQVDHTTVPDTSAAAGKVTVIGTGTVGNDRAKLQIHLPPTQVTTGGRQGSLAWWIGGENQKARLPQPYKTAPATSVARWAAQAKSHSVSDPAPFRLESLLDNPAPAEKAIALQQADLIATKAADKASREFFHDLSAVSTGLLTNSATGGWRKDLSLFSESWASQPQTGLPLFQLSPDPVLNTQGARATAAAVRQPGSLFYPWSQYQATSNLQPFQQPVASWNNLIDFVTFYKKTSAADYNSVTTGPAGVRKATAWAYVGDDTFTTLHKVRLFPVIARVQWVFSHFAESAGPDPQQPGQQLYTPKLLMTPVITMWNPYDLELTVPHNMYFETKVIPVALSYQVGTAANSVYNCVLYINNTTKPTSNLPCLLDFVGGNGNYNTCGFPAGLVLKPGETKVFSPASNDRKPPTGNGGPWGADHTLDLLPGYRGSGGHVYPVRNSSGIVTAKPANTKLKAYVSFDTEYYEQWGTNGVGIYIEVRTKDPEKYLEWIRTGYSPGIATALHPRIVGSDALEIQRLDELVSNPKPFLSTIFGPRMATRVINPANPQYYTKGLSQSSPFNHFPPLTFRQPTFASTHHEYAGNGHPVNLGFEYSYVTHTSGVDNNLPNASADGKGYLITGIQSSDGIPRCVLAEVPSRPLASLGELVNWDLRFENPCPPFSFNLVGNSDASPLLPANAVYNSSEAGMSDNMRHDDSYCANHLLFDDWFLSSITPEPSATGIPARDLRTVYTEFVNGKTPLVNRAYEPIQADRAAVSVSDVAVNTLFNNNVNKTSSWRTIASRLEVNGMFNVNSTSVTAWRALLGHARKQCVPYLNSAGGVALSAQTEHPVSRFSIAGDDEATKVAPGGVFPEANEFTGYRVLDDEFLDELAKQVVVQVRNRGPFLSLAEFVNRQLSYGDLALAGALQAALNEVTKDGAATDPFATIKGNSEKTNIAPPALADAENQLAYQVPAAAAGYSTYGVPGWTRQADILRPLAPILSVRDDTFIVRGYGDARDVKGRILARDVCEAVVRRTRGFIDPADGADMITPPTKPNNKVFGRHFEIISFRWLAPNEV